MELPSEEEGKLCAGIDLGTSNSVLSLLVNGSPEVIPNTPERAKKSRTL